MDAMKQALLNRKNDIEAKLKLKVQVEVEPEEGSDEGKNEKSVAPVVKDQEEGKKAFSDKIQPEVSLEMDDEDAMAGLPEAPMMRPPQTLGEKIRTGLEEQNKKTKMKGSV
jgi:hypothetical protein